MAIIIWSYQRGDLQRVTGKGVESRCFGDAFTPETMNAWRNRFDRKTVVVFDRTQWTHKELEAEAA
jgi:hypothetical protein